MNVMTSDFDVASASGTSQEKPQNGIAGLKHLRHDILSGIVVSLVSLPLSSGIAIASGAPPVIGLISAIIAGFLFPLIGGAYMTIAGPAAGLAPALMAIMVSFGGAGDAHTVGEGYHFLLVVIFVVGCLQVVLSILKLARYAAIIPVVVVEGMLASIGLLIIIKQLPAFFGYTQKPHAHEFIQYVMEVPNYVRGMTGVTFGVALASLCLLFVLDGFKKYRILQILPPHLIAVIFGSILGYVFQLGKVNPAFLVHLPENPFHGIHSPAFGELLARRDLWTAAIVGIIMLTMIDGVESLATAMAIDRIDPFHRRSNANRVLLAMGISNIASSLVGGLTIIPGGVKSKANIAAGGRTLWANFTNSICLLIYLLLATSLINMIPLCVLASVLIFTGWKMCEPVIWRHISQIGREQLVIFSFTIAVTLMTDLLMGIIAGVVAKLIFDLWTYREATAIARASGIKGLSLISTFCNFFRNPVEKKEMAEGIYHLYVNKPLVCFNVMQMSQELDHIPEGAKAVCVHLNENVALIDHTSVENLLHAIEEYSHSAIPIEIVGPTPLMCLSKNRASVRVALPMSSENQGSSF
jgi:carbonic anhydrase